MESFWEYWYWYWFMLVVFYYAAVLENAVGIQPFWATPVRYKPPEGVGVLLSGMIYDKFNQERDFVAAILDLEVSGFVNIVHTHNEDIAIKKEDTPKREATQKEAYLLNEILFPSGRSVYEIPRKLAKKVRRGNKPEWILTARGREIVQDRFALSKQVAKWVEKEGYMVENPRGERRKFFWISILLILLMFVLSAISGMVPLLAAGILLFFFYAPILLFFHGGLKGALVQKVFALIIASPLIVPIVLKFHIPEFRAALFDEMHLWLYLLLGIMEVAFILIYEHVGTLTAKGREVRHHLQGYKMFLKRVKLDEVRREQERNPKHIDEVFPYMVLLGIERYNMNLGVLRPYVR